MQSNKEIIAFVGRAGSGKDYQCKLLEEQGYIHMSFAATLRKQVAKLLNMSIEDFMVDYDNFKSVELLPGFTVRHLMQNVATETRSNNKDYYVNNVTFDIIKSKCKKICISDLRFFNEWQNLTEFAKFNLYEFKVYFCDYHSNRYEENNLHESAALANYLFSIGLKDQELVTPEMFNKFAIYKQCSLT